MCIVIWRFCSYLDTPSAGAGAGRSSLSASPHPSWCAPVSCWATRTVQGAPILYLQPLSARPRFPPPRVSCCVSVRCSRCSPAHSDCP